ncbi:hypothetical protein AAF712_001526 [Marasmius tenuissimus]|uniref:RING-type domain-containing protein n=1 Tax=Marasmius tenuissimus TaxID=585030 RepID=A0ABR3AE08_9AGAR
MAFSSILYDRCLVLSLFFPPTIAYNAYEVSSQDEDRDSTSRGNIIVISDSDEDEKGVKKTVTQNTVEDELSKLQKEVKRLRSVNCSITRKWTTAESSLKAMRQNLDSSVQTDDPCQQEAHKANEDFLKRWIVEAEEKLKVARQERDALNTAVRTLQQQRDALLAQQQHMNITVVTLQQQRDGLQNEAFAQQQLVTYLNARCASAEAESSRITQKCLEISCIDDMLICIVCLDDMSVPWVLSCGHTFCSECLSSWFHHILTEFKLTFAHYEPGRRTYHYQLTQEDHTQIAHASVAHELADVLSQKRHPHPVYTCPVCRSPAEKPPSQNFNLKDLLTAVAEKKGAGLQVQGNDSQWHQFWPTQSELFQAIL